MKQYLLASCTAIVCTLMFCATAIHISDKRIAADREAQIQSSAELEKILDDPQKDVGGYAEPTTAGSVYDGPVKVHEVP